jgi:hypothetical protein
MIGHILSQMFAWPQGIVVGNLIASFLIWFPHYIWLLKSHRKLHHRLDTIEGNQNAVRNQRSE